MPIHPRSRTRSTAGKMPAVGPTPAFTPPPVVRRKLSNGLEVLIAERHQLPILTLNLVVRGGENLAPEGKTGLVEMTADLLTEGTTSRDALKLAGELSEIGANLNASGSLETCSLFLTTLTRHEAKALEFFADVLLHPAFPKRIWSGCGSRSLPNCCAGAISAGDRRCRLPQDPLRLEASLWPDRYRQDGQGLDPRGHEPILRDDVPAE